MTLIEFSETTGRRPEAVAIKLRRTFGGKFGKQTLLADEHLLALQTDRRANKTKAEPSPKTKRTNKTKQGPLVTETISEATQPPQTITIQPDVLPEQPAGLQKYRSFILGFLLVAPTAASVTNMYDVSYSITQEAVTAGLYTTVLALTAMGFTIARVKSWVTVGLSLILIGYESFCNLSRLYFGLMGGVKGDPTRFLGTVTDLFDTGSHGTALAIAGFSALMLAAVQYATIFELQKNNNNGK